MVKKLYFRDTLTDFTIPAGFIYCSIQNLGLDEATLITANGISPLVAGTSFDVTENLAGYENLAVQTNGNRVAIHYKMK